MAQELDELLLSLFDIESLKRFLRYLPDGERILSTLPNVESDLQYAEHAARTLTQQGYTQETVFWNALIAERPRRRLDIEKTASNFTIDKSSERRRDLVILVVAANPIAGIHIRVDRELSSIAQRIRGTQFRDTVKLITESSVSLQRMISLLSEHQPNVLHISSHGLENAIVLEDELSEDGSRIQHNALIQLLSAFSDSLRVVVFNMAYSSDMAREITGKIPLAIGIKGLVTDKASISFSVTFYESLCFGRTIENAFAIAQAHVAHHDGPESAYELFPIMENDVDSVRKLRLVQADQ